VVEPRALWASGLGVRRGRRWVFRDVEVGVAAGQVVRLSGTDGSGKSTLLRVVAGVTRPTAGLVRHRPPIVGYVPPRFPAPIGLRTRQYLDRLARLRGMSRTEADEQAGGLIDRFTLHQVAESLIVELSGEDLRKLAFAQAVLDRPSLLILDEPWGDLKGRALVLVTAELGRLAEAGCVVMFTDRRRRVPGIAVDQNLSLSGGILFPLPIGEPDGEHASMRIDLSGQGQSFEHARGVVEYRLHHDGVTVIAEYGQTTDIVRVALQSGWLIRRVEPYA
jgi:ABC-2 type transport system ATP-binding protein